MSSTLMIRGETQTVGATITYLVTFCATNSFAAFATTRQAHSKNVVIITKLKIIVRKATASAPKVTFTQEARSARPHILLCIVRSFPIANLKKFLQLQNTLHDTECNRRQLATIATHDLAKVKGALRYHAAPPAEIEITALGSAAQGKVTAEQYYADLCHQAELLRKEKKRNTYSGVHKYITLLTARELFAYLSDEEKVISLPPLTNCDETKVSATTTDLLLEVTSSVGHGPCVRVMNVLLERMLLMGRTSVQ